MFSNCEQFNVMRSITMLKRTSESWMTGEVTFNAFVLGTSETLQNHRNLVVINNLVVIKFVNMGPLSQIRVGKCQ